MTKLPFVDRHQTEFFVSADLVWSSLLELFRTEMSSASSFARALGCDPIIATKTFQGTVGESVAGFRIAEAEPKRRLVLEGRHRFAQYRLIFNLDHRVLSAETFAAFPGLQGAFYKTAVIYTGGHWLITKFLLHEIVRRANLR